MRLAEGSPLAHAELGCAYARSAAASEAEDILQGLAEVSTRKYVSPYCFALVHAALGQTDLAFETWKAPIRRAPTR